MELEKEEPEAKDPGGPNFSDMFDSDYKQKKNKGTEAQEPTR